MAKARENETPPWFFGIGAQKAGTTWLYSYLQEHPKVFVPAIKELHYFDTMLLPQHFPDTNSHFQDSLDWYMRKLPRLPLPKLEEIKELISHHYFRVRMIDDLDEYVRFFDIFSKGRALRGEVTPSYSMLPAEGFRMMRALHDDVRFVLLLRDPISRFWSAQRMQKRRQPSYDLHGGAISSVATEENVLRSDYRRTIDALLSVVDVKNVFIGFYETLFSEDEIRRLTDFLRIDYREPDFSHRPNASEHYDIPADVLDLLSTQLKPVYDYCFAEFGDSIPENWRAHAVA